jgi:pyruvate kinase
VIPAHVTSYRDTDEMFLLTRQWVQDQGLAGSGDRLIITAGVPVGVPGNTNLLKVLQVDKEG